MYGYILKRLLLMIPTLLGIMIVNFAIIQLAPGGPVEQTIAKIKGLDTDVTERFSGAGSQEAGGGHQANKAQFNSQTESKYRGAQGLDPALIAEIEAMYGFDKPITTRFWDMLTGYATFDFGESFFRDESVVNLVMDKLPVSISLGLWTTLIVYLISIPLGIRKAVKDGSTFDVWSSVVVTIGYAIPSFLFAFLLILLFAGGAYFDWFPLRGIVSNDFSQMSWDQKLADYAWHMVLPVTALVISEFAILTNLTKNYFLEEIRKQYVSTARAKGCSERQVLYGHVFRNAMLVIIAGLPGAFLGLLFTGALLIEVMFSLDGLGLLGFEAVINRDYPVIFGTLFVFSLLGLLVSLVSDLMYAVVDPRIDFEKRQ